MYDYRAGTECDIPVGESSLRDFLEGSGLEEDWRPQLEEILLQRARDFVSTDVFSDWMRAVVD